MIFHLAPLFVLIPMFVGLWLISVWKKDASIVDIAWGPAFFVVVLTGVVQQGAGTTTRALLVLALVAVWSSRLAIHLAARARGRGEDYRYAEMRRAHGARFVWVSLFTVFLLQVVLVFIVSLPLQSVFFRSAPPRLGALDLVAAFFVLLGIALEAIADLQLTRFRRAPESRGRVLDQGLWRYSRHPNYFGDAVVWWGFGLIGVAGGAWWTIAGPLLMTVLLLRVSGVSLLEKTIADRRPEYTTYVQRTSAFFPLPPKSI